LACLEAEDIAEDENGELAMRQGLKRGDEGQGDGFGLLVADLRAEGHVDRPLDRASGNGSSHVTSPSRVGSGGSTPGTSYALAGRRVAERRALRHRLVAIL